MSLGFKSLWRTGSWCIGIPGAFQSQRCDLRCRARAFPYSSFTNNTLRQGENKSDKNVDIESLLLSDQASTIDVDSPTQVHARVMPTNHARNVLLRNAFRDDSPSTRLEVAEKRSSPYVPQARDYPSPAATNVSKEHANKIARVQVGFDRVWSHFGKQVPDWNETFKLLKRMTPKRGESQNMAAVRVVLPSSWDLSVGNKRIEFLDATTGLATKLRVSADHQNSSAVVLRGESSILAKAAEELIRACPDVEIFKLGEVATFDYNAKRLWPAIDNSGDGHELALSALGKQGSGSSHIWLHKEMQTYWIDRPYEQTPKPKWWTKDSFAAYITALVCGRLRPHLAMKFYKQTRDNGKLIDTEGIRVNLILEAFEDPSARECITPSILTMALAFMAHKGGHRASADLLFTRAEEWGLPMDTEVFNVILDGYGTKRDAAFFHEFLQKMERQYFYPNARTWLHFLKLVQRDDQRRQIIAAMYETGLFEDPATRRGIATIMASSDAYTAFKSGKDLERFLAEQVTRYGEDWFTLSALNHILTEFLRFHDTDRNSPDFESFKTLLMNRKSEDGRKMDVSTANIVLESCIRPTDWPTALWVLSYMAQHDCELNHHSYDLLLQLAIRSRASSSTGVIFFYGVLDRKLRNMARKSMQAIFLKRLFKGSTSASFTGPKIFSKQMAKALRGSKIARPTTAVAGAEWAVLRACDGYKPVKTLLEALEVTYHTMDKPALRAFLNPQQPSTGKKPPKGVVMSEYVVTLRDVSGRRDQMVVRLDAAFDADTMIRDWEPSSHLRQETADGPGKEPAEAAAKT